MTWYNALITVGAVAGAILSIKALIKPILDKVNEVMDELKATRAEARDNAKKIDKLEEHSREHYLELLKHTIMNPEIPLAERLISGKKYIDLGGNGEVKQYYEKLVKEHTK